MTMSIYLEVDLCSWWPLEAHLGEVEGSHQWVNDVLQIGPDMPDRRWRSWGWRCLQNNRRCMCWSSNSSSSNRRIFIACCKVCRLTTTGTDLMFGNFAPIQLFRISICSSVGLRIWRQERSAAQSGSPAYLICSFKMTTAFNDLQS